MDKQKISQEFRLKNYRRKRYYFIEEIKQNELMSNNYKNICTTLNYFEHLLILVSAVTGCVFISAFIFSWYFYGN